MAYQTRSTRTEALLLAELGEAGLQVESIDPAEQHPDFRVCVDMGGVGCWVPVPGFLFVWDLARLSVVGLLCAADSSNRLV